MYVKSLKIHLNDIQDLYNYLDKVMGLEFSDVVVALISDEAQRQAAAEISTNDNEWEREIDRIEQEQQDKLEDIRSLVNDLLDTDTDTAQTKQKILAIKHILY